ncbi:MAG: hypothetical protein V7L01_30665 [Nostoc sp.]
MRWGTSAGGLALREGFPPQVTAVGYGELYSYGETTALASRESGTLRVA